MQDDGQIGVQPRLGTRTSQQHSSAHGAVGGAGNCSKAGRKLGNLGPRGKGGQIDQGQARGLEFQNHQRAVAMFSCNYLTRSAGIAARSEAAAKNTTYGVLAALLINSRLPDWAT